MNAYILRRYSPAHLVNKLALLAAVRLKPEKTWVLPTSAQIEMTNRCNCRCTMCQIEELTAIRPAKYMTLKEFKFITDQIPGLRAVNLTGIGESLLNTGIFDIIAYCVKKGLNTGMITNGMLLDASKGESLIRSGLSTINISIDSINPETFRKLRVNADFKTVSTNVKKFIEKRNSLGSQTPRVQTITVATNKNKDEIPDILQYLYDLGVDQSFVKTFNPHHNPELEIPRDDVRYQVPVIKKAQTPQNGSRPFSAPVGFTIDRGTVCRWPWTMTYITVEGDVTPCCIIGDARKMNFGNVYREPFKKIWNGPAIQKFRRTIKQGSPAVCATCDEMKDYSKGKRKTL